MLRALADREDRWNRSWKPEAEETRGHASVGMKHDQFDRDEGFERQVFGEFAFLVCVGLLCPARQKMTKSSRQDFSLVDYF